MLDDRDDDKYEGSDEPEYHFSEEEGGDYVDTEAPKDTGASVTDAEPKATGGVRALAPSKRMMISLVVFLVLVYVVYKMVAPTSPPAPSTEIAATTPAQTAKPATVEAAKMQQNVPTVSAPVVASPPTTTATTVQTTSPTPTQPMVPAPAPMQPMPPATPPAVSVSAVTPQGQIIPIVQPAPAAPAQQPMPAAAQPPMVQQQPPVMQQTVVAPVTQQPMQQPPGTQPSVVLQQPPMMQQGGPPQTTTQPPQPQGTQQALVQPSTPPPPAFTQGITGMPSVIPVESPTTTVALPASPLNPMANDARIVSLQSDSAKLMSQLQSDYVQKLNDFSTQNRALQDEVQTLNSRMSAMESQINQLVQALTRQGQAGGAVNEPPPAPIEQPVVIDQKTSYNVQAIIPGRAWLRTDSGETLTVAEGDVIKSLGRVTKIDPYDGIVEINTGNKVVSLSYGTAA